MSTFCGGSTSVPSFTFTELKADYPGGILQSVDLSSINDSDQWIQSTIQKLEDANIIPKPKFGKSPESVDSLEDYSKNDSILQESIKREYCFYESRYFSALDLFLQSISDASMKGKSVDVNSRLQITKELNSKLIVFTKVVNGISKYRYSNNAKLNISKSSINRKLQERKERISEQAQILNSESATIDVYNRMIEYTKEKNRANQNLLTLYGILNIVAVGIVVYIARN